MLPTKLCMDAWIAFRLTGRTWLRAKRLTKVTVRRVELKSRLQIQ